MRVAVAAPDWVVPPDHDGLPPERTYCWGMLRDTDGGRYALLRSLDARRGRASGLLVQVPAGADGLRVHARGRSAPPPSRGRRSGRWRKGPRSRSGSTMPR